MMQMTLKQAADLLDVKPFDFNGNFSGISIDTRTLQKGALFAAIPGERVDGHDFVEEARAKGAAAALVTRKVESSLPQILVKDITEALGILSKAWREKFNIPFIAVTGSNGKTTLKNMIASILTAACQGNALQVLATQGTLNNHLGLPLTLARLSATHRYAAIEMGMNHFGEIEYLTKITRPTTAVITNAAACHLEGVGDLAGVARAKAEIFLGLAPNGTAVLNRDDAFYHFWREQAGKRPIITFGFHPEADVNATLHTSTTSQQMTITTPKGSIHVVLPLLGKHNALNALAATAAAISAGIELDAIKAGLENIVPAQGRMQIHTLQNGAKVIDDTYNANPFSLQAAVDTLAAFAGKRVLVLGDMKELGADEKNLHQSAGLKIRSAGIDCLFTYGNLTTDTAHAFGDGAYHFTEQEKLLTALKPMLQNQTTILIKGSRSMKMEMVVKGLVGLSS